MLSRINKTGFFHLLSSNLLVAIGGFSSQLLVAYWLTSSELATVKTFQNFILIGSVLSSLGINSAILKLASEKRKKSEINSIFIASFALAFGSSLVLVSILYILVFFTLDQTNIYYGILMQFSVVILLINIYNLQSAYLQARQMVRKLAFLQMVSRLIGIGSIILFTYLFGVFGFLSGFVFSYFVNNILFYSSQKNEYNFSEVGQKVLRWYKKIWSYSRFGWGSNMASHLAAYSDMILLSIYFSNSSELGQYAFATIIIMGYQMITSTMQQVLTPKFSYIATNPDKLYKQYKYFLPRIIFVSLTIALLSILLYKPLIETLYSGKFTDSFDFFIFLVLAWAIKNIYSYQVTFLFGIGKFKTIFKNSLLLSIITLLLLLLVANFYTILSVAISLVAISIIGLILYSKSVADILKSTHGVYDRENNVIN